MKRVLWWLVLMTLSGPLDAEPARLRVAPWKLPLLDVMEALQSEGVPQRVCIATSGPEALGEETAALAGAVSAVIARQPMVAGVKTLRGAPEGDAELGAAALRAGCDVALAARVYPPTEQDEVPRVLLALVDTEGDPMWGGQSRLLVTPDARTHSATEEASEDIERVGTRRGIPSEFWKRALRLHGDLRNARWEATILDANGIPLSAKKIHALAVQGPLKDRAAAEDARHEQLETRRKLAMIPAVAAPFVTALPGGIAGMLCGVGFFFACASSTSSAVLLACLGAIGGVIGLVAGAVLGLPVLLVGLVAGPALVQAAAPPSTTVLTVEDAALLVIEHNVRLAAALDMPVDNIPAPYLPSPGTPIRSVENPLLSEDFAAEDDDEEEPPDPVRRIPVLTAPEPDDAPHESRVIE